MHAKFECKFVNCKSMLDVILAFMKINILIERRLRLVLYTELLHFVLSLYILFTLTYCFLYCCGVGYSCWRRS